MPLHLYCIVPADRAPRDIAGIDGAQVRAVAVHAIACWVSDHEQRPPAAAAALRAHNAVVTAAMDPHCTPVPLRFGQSLADEDAVRRELERAADDWAARLDRLAGCAEFGIRVEYATPPPDPEDAAGAREMHTQDAHRGTEYMAALARRRKAAAHRRSEGDRIASLIRERAAAVIRDSRIEHLTTPGGLITMANLVAWHSVATYHACVHEIRTTHVEWRFLDTGPWPPYSFVA